MIGFRLTVLPAQSTAVLHGALPPDADEIAELEAFLPALAGRGFSRAVLDLSTAPAMDAHEALMLCGTVHRLAERGITLALVAAAGGDQPARNLGIPVHHCLSDALLQGN